MPLVRVCVDSPDAADGPCSTAAQAHPTLGGKRKRGVSSTVVPRQPKRHKVAEPLGFRARQDCDWKQLLIGESTIAILRSEQKFEKRGEYGFMVQAQRDERGLRWVCETDLCFV